MSRPFKKVVVLSLFLSGLLGCNGDSVSRTLEMRSDPRFVAANQSFRFMQAHPRGAKFELLTSPQNEYFVMTHTKNSATLVLLTPVPMNLEYGMMLDEKLCSTGLISHRQKNWTEGRYALNVTASPYSNVKVSAPVGVCFSRSD